MFTEETAGHPARVWRYLLSAVCVAVLCIILTLGLWPFHAPSNGVAWLGHCNGLTLNQSGSAIAAAYLPLEHPDTQASASVEIWLQPERVWNAATFLSFYTPGQPPHLSLRQSLTDLELQSGNSHIYIGGVFRRPRSVFLTITAGPSGTSVYLNGALIRHAAKFPLSVKDLTGRLIVGDSPEQPDSWSGQILGLAIYRQELSPTRVQSHYDTWTRLLRPELTADDRNLALYLFDERSGKVVHDRAASGDDLYIPEKYQVVDKLFLEPFWQEFGFSRSYWESAVKNVVGFLPFGFCFYPWLVLHRFRRSGVITVILGTMVSLTIEVLQAYLPTRDSGMTDLFTNTIGTWAGVLAFRSANHLLRRRYQTNLIPQSDT